MTRADAIARARDNFTSGAFLAELDRRVAYRTESQNSERADELRARCRSAAFIGETIVPCGTDE